MAVCMSNVVVVISILGGLRGGDAALLDNGIVHPVGCNRWLLDYHIKEE